MAAKRELSALVREGFAAMAERAQGDARKLAVLAAHALRNGPADQAYPLARQARALAPDDREVRSLTAAAFSAGVPGWHFGIVRDDARNAAYEEALERAIRPGMRVLDIGTGTGLLAMMAARAGAAAVVTCEMKPAIADAAAEIVAANGYSDRVRVVAKRSTDIDPDADMGGPADLLVSEIISNNMLGQDPLTIVEDAAARLLKPGAAMIPASGQVMVALAHWAGLAERRMARVAGFDMAAFNRLDHSSYRLKMGDPGIALRSAPAELFDFDFASGGPFRPRRNSLALAAEGGPVNGVVQWIRLQLDAAVVYENKPAPGASSCWSCLFYPFDEEMVAPDAAVRVHGAHDRLELRIRAEA